MFSGPIKIFLNYLNQDIFEYPFKIFVRKCYRIMLGIKQSRDYVTNVRFINELTRCQSDEPINRYVLILSKTISSARRANKNLQITNFVSHDDDDDNDNDDDDYDDDDYDDDDYDEAA